MNPNAHPWTDEATWDHEERAWASPDPESFTHAVFDADTGEVLAWVRREADAAGIAKARGMWPHGPRALARQIAQGDQAMATAEAMLAYVREERSGLAAIDAHIPNAQIEEFVTERTDDQRHAIVREVERWTEEVKRNVHLARSRDWWRARARSLERRLEGSQSSVVAR